MRPFLTLLLAACLGLTGCAAAADTDGEAVGVAAAAGAPGSGPSATDPLGPPPPRPEGSSPTPVVVDTDLGADDLLALAFLLRHPDVDVRALTIPTTGLVGCRAGLGILGALFAELPADPVPVACGHDEAGPGARAFPASWRSAAEAGSGAGSLPGRVPVLAQPAPELIARAASASPGLVVVALGPMTNLARAATDFPEEYARVAAVHAMAGSVSGPLVDGVAEWNAAADPSALATVLGAPVPVTVVPEDAVPTGTPDEVHVGVVGRVAATADVPAWWDLAAAAALVAPDAGTREAARWTLEPTDPGRLRAAGPGGVQVYRSLDASALAREYATVFTAG